MNRWEYKMVVDWIVDNEAPFQAIVKDLGVDGWELVSVVNSPIQKKFHYFFKRPIQ